MKVMVAIPAYSGQLHMGTVRSLFTDLQTLSARGDHWTLNDECGSGLIAQTRGQQVAQFLASDCDQLVFIDDDVCWEAGAMLRLLDHDVDFAMGVYPYRRDPIAFPVHWTDAKELWAENGLLEIRGGPFGFVKLRREGVQSLYDAHEELEFQCRDAPEGKARHLFGDYWPEAGLLLGEDMAFCARWRDHGGKVWLDPEIKFGHIGFKTFEGHLGDWLRNRN